jgi:hypothetical protein
MPNNYDPIVDTINFEQVQHASKAMREDIAQGVSQAKTQADFLRVMGAASNTEPLRAR